MNPIASPGAAPSGDVIELALSRRKQSQIALELNWPESKVSELKSKLQRDGVMFLKALGLKIVPEDLEHYDSHSVHTMLEALKIAARDLTPRALQKPEA